MEHEVHSNGIDPKKLGMKVGFSHIGITKKDKDSTKKQRKMAKNSRKISRKH